MRMQLNRPGDRHSLAAWAPIAPIALIAWLAPTSAHADGAKLSTDVVVYTDTDSVLVASPQVTARRELDQDGGEASARVVVDAVTAASVDVISNATQRFSEVRTQLDLAVSKAIRSSLPSLSYRFSHEPDYRSHGLGIGTQQRLAGADTVLAAGYRVLFDTVRRVDTPADAFSESLITHTGELGVTQVVDEQTLVRVAYTFTAQFGYMEKPYRLVPLFDPPGLAAAFRDRVTLDLNTYDDYRLPYSVPENVPDDRYRHALSARALRYIEALRSSIRLDYRFYGDSWGVYAHTVEPAITHAVNDRWRLGAWSRVHVQNSASFWKRTFVARDADSVPILRTMDRSLSASWHATGGASMHWTRGAWSVYAEMSAMYSRFTEHLLIDSRVAVITQGGCRWSF